MPRSVPLALVSSTTILLSSLFAVSAARAEVDCPAGSFLKSEDGFTWCQPTVCENDGQCKPDEVCRPIALCMQVGALADAGATVDAGKRLVVTQRCAPEKVCPQLQTCSDLGRCVLKTTADKMGILTVSSASPAAASGDPAKKSCGCRAVGANAGTGGALTVGLALGILALRRRRKAEPS